MPEKPKKILLEVIQHTNCPLYLKGNRMVLAPPEVLRNSSDRICALAVSKLLPTALRRLGEMADPGFQPPIVECPGCSGGTAQFVIKPFKGSGETVRVRPKKNTAVVERPAPFLSELPSEVVEQVLAKCDVRRYSEPTVIVEEHSEGEHLHFIGKGGADVIKTSAEGKEKVIWNLIKGDCFGEMSVLTGQPSSATIRTCSEDTAILSLPKDSLDELIAAVPIMAKQISILLSQRLRTTNEDLVDAKDNTLAGELSVQIQLGNVIQNLNQNALSGTLVLKKSERSDEEGMITFSDGEIANAKFAALSGEDAVYEMMAWREGLYRFNDDKDPKRRTRHIVRNTTMLLMEGMRRIDEASR